jgi:ferredoxin
MMTGHPGIFAGGDMVPAERTVTVAIGHGKKAARHIDAWLRGERLRARSQARARELRQAQHLVLRRRAEDRAPQLDADPPRLDLRRGHGGLDETNALFEARRCLSCGNCFECDNCYGVCPDNAVIKLGPARLRVRLRLLQGLRHLRSIQRTT